MATTTVGRPLDMARALIAAGKQGAQEVQGDNEAWEIGGQADTQYADLASKTVSVIAPESARERWKVGKAS